MSLWLLYGLCSLSRSHDIDSSSKAAAQDAPEQSSEAPSNAPRHGIGGIETIKLLHSLPDLRCVGEARYLLRLSIRIGRSRGSLGLGWRAALSGDLRDEELARVAAV